jgi:hypothetical protein
MIKITKGTDHGSKSCYTCQKGGVFDEEKCRIIDVPTDLNTLRIGSKQNTNAMTMCYGCLRRLSYRLLDFFEKL